MVVCIYVGLKMDMLPLNVFFLFDHYFYLIWVCPFLWQALLFTVMWKILQSSEHFWRTHPS